MRTALFFVTLLFSMPLVLFPQERNDIGIIAGSSYYIGDYNFSTPFYKPSPAIGALFRHNFNDLLSFSTTVAMGWIKGEYNPKEFYLPGETPAFSHRVLQLDAAMEIGFIPFNTHRQKHKAFTPYVTVGVGIAYIDNKIIFNLPMGIGMKYSPANRWTLGMEWRFYKTFYDGIDGYINITDNPRSIIHNNDWFSMAGFFASYRIFRQSALCPAYK